MAAVFLLGRHCTLPRSVSSWRLDPLPEKLLWNPEDMRAPYSLVFDTRSWVEIKPMKTHRFRGFTYNTPPPDQVVRIG